MNERNIAFPSTGTPEGDAAEALRIQRTERFLELGECPNGCGQLRKVADKQYSCPACGYLNLGRDLSAGHLSGAAQRAAEAIEQMKQFLHRGALNYKADDFVDNVIKAVRQAEREAAAQAIHKAECEAATVKELMRRDESGLIQHLNQVKKLVDSYSWLIEGRGCYEYDDDRYREEAGNALRAIKECAQGGIEASGKLYDEVCFNETVQRFSGSATRQI